MKYIYCDFGNFNNRHPVKAQASPYMYTIDEKKGPHLRPLDRLHSYGD